MANAVEVQDLSKRFRLYHQKYTSLKERILHAGKIPYEDFWALAEVNLEIAEGGSVGILGRNGCGKSTLLKCVAGILQPTTGQVVVRGHLAAMLELGAGMQPELSGRDNIYLNGSLLGLSRRDIDRRFDAIVEFAELEQFIDNQVKYYSSGMYVRLGFAVAVNVEPDVLLVDEVLAVGDERFQAKCLDKVAEFQRDGRTIIVVSHAPDLLRQLCDEIIVMDHGHVVAVDEPGPAIRSFRETLITAGLVVAEPEVEGMPSALEKRLAEFTSLTVDHPGFGERPYLITGEPLRITAELAAREEIPGARFGVVMLSERNEVVSAQISEALPGGDVLDAGPNRVSFIFDTIPLLDGRFTVNIDVRDGQGIMLAYQGTTFEVMNPDLSTGLFSMPMRMEAGEGV